MRSIRSSQKNMENSLQDLADRDLIEIRSLMMIGILGYLLKFGYFVR